MPPPQARPRRLIPRPSVKTGYRNALAFRVLDLNCLAPTLVDQRYQDHDADIMDPDFREQEVLAEIEIKDPDILALQEVEPQQFERYLQSLNRRGYSGRYQKHHGGRDDGIATMWKDSIFELVEEKVISFLPAAPGDANLRAQMTSLRLREADVFGQHPVVIVVNCHLVFNFAKSGLKLAQISRLLAEIHMARLRLAPAPPSFQTDIEIKGGGVHLAVYDPRTSRLPTAIFLGDFNFTPYSPMYSFLATGVMPDDVLKVARSPEVLPEARLLSGQAVMFGHAANMNLPGLRQGQRHVLKKAIESTPMFCIRGAERGCNARTDWRPITPSDAEHLQRWLATVCPNLNFSSLQQTVVFELEASESSQDSTCGAHWLKSVTEKLSEVGLTIDAVARAMSTAALFHSPLFLRSALRLPKPPDTTTDCWAASEPWATVYQGNQRGTVDYMWIEETQLEVVRAFSLPTESQFRRSGAVPNDHWPLSDHYSLCADLAFREGPLLGSTLVMSLKGETSRIRKSVEMEDVNVFLCLENRKRYLASIEKQRECNK